MNDERIKYLIKFVSEKSHAEDLVRGKLFMRPATYYHMLEQKKGPGQGDLGEASVVDGQCAYKHSHVPVYCLYAVMENDINDGNIYISKRCIDDFGCQKGFAVLIDYKKLQPLLSQVKTGGHELDAGLVTYHSLTLENMAGLLNDKTPQNLFIKRPYFSYQKEYRIVVCEQLYKENEKPIYEKAYWFENPLDVCAKIIPISSLTRIDDNYVFSLQGK